MQQQPFNQNHTQAGSVNMNHGGHELFDAHEMLATTVNVLDQYMIFRPYVKDQQLLSILDHQYGYITTQYNRMVEAFSTGQKPTTSIGPYEMDASTDVTYGITPSQPKKPNANLSEVKETGISAHMLGLIKSTSSLFAMAAPEVTHPVFRRVIADSIPDWIEMAYEIFLYQNKHGYYQVPKLQQADMTAMLNSFTTSSTNIKTSTTHLH
ncbi:spore coat protein [Geomicrobium sediminis]|uniref:Spore coat protein CotF n=1 Tax=Geomicrobium sediminis TaxID=1347788 RepID=A0ABS2PIW9_9BACL|nr:spore coat protein [Geomicrobium sediminis]MBM7634768.1 spore coat protein CotF [Geomicrobium sediminis]